MQFALLHWRPCMHQSKHRFLNRIVLCDFVLHYQPIHMHAQFFVIYLVFFLHLLLLSFSIPIYVISPWFSLCLYWFFFLFLETLLFCWAFLDFIGNFDTQHRYWVCLDVSIKASKHQHSTNRTKPYDETTKNFVFYFVGLAIIQSLSMFVCFENAPKHIHIVTVWQQQLIEMQYWMFQTWILFVFALVSAPFQSRISFWIWSNNFYASVETHTRTHRAIDITFWLVKICLWCDPICGGGSGIHIVLSITMMRAIQSETDQFLCKLFPGLIKSISRTFSNAIFYFINLRLLSKETACNCHLYEAIAKCQFIDRAINWPNEYTKPFTYLVNFLQEETLDEKKN